MVRPHERSCGILRPTIVGFQCVDGKMGGRGRLRYACGSVITDRVMPLPEPAARWHSTAQHERIYAEGTDLEKIRYLGVLRLDPLGDVGQLGAEVAGQHNEYRGLGRLAINLMNAWAWHDTSGRVRQAYSPPLSDVILADMYTAEPGPNAPGLGTDTGRLIRRAITALSDSTPTNWRRFVALLNEVAAYVGTLMLGTLLTQLDDPGVVRHQEEQGDGVRPALRLACHMAAPIDTGGIPSRRIDPKVCGRASHYSTYLADALVDRVGLTAAELSRDSRER